ncbi:glycoside hydrolase family protein [Serratia quinivorans]|uniref:glycoside hydrolase family protein n=1 Tax=Serratia quinivorans TaxID=137545 RepID=UPI0036F2B77A
MRLLDYLIFNALVFFTFNLGTWALQRKLNREEHERFSAELMKWVWTAGKKLPGGRRRLLHSVDSNVDDF